MLSNDFYKRPERIGFPVPIHFEVANFYPFGVGYGEVWAALGFPKNKSGALPV